MQSEELNRATFLNFRLDPFHRVSWTSSGAQAVWAPRLKQIRRASFQTHLWMIAAGKLPGVVRDVAAWEWLGLQGGLGERIGAARCRWGPYHDAGVGLAADDYRAIRYRVLFFRKEQEASFVEAVAHADRRTLAALLEVPDCCRGAARDVFERFGCDDLFLAAALRTPERVPREHVPDEPIPGEHKSSERIVLLDIPPALNVSLRVMGIEAVFHAPCHFHCDASLSIGQTFLESMGKAGFGQEQTWLAELLSWPVEWSCLHGIAEVKTPVLKLVTYAEPTAHKHTVRLQGRAYPEEGETGLRHPYRSPVFSKIRDSQAYQDGLVHGNS